MILTEQEIDVEANKTLIQLQGLTRHMWRSYGRAIEAKVIEKIKAQGEVAWLHRQRTDSDVITTAVKHVWGNVAVGSLAAYDIPLYRLPEGD